MRQMLRRIPPAFYISLILMAVFGSVTKGYFTPGNLAVIFRQAAPLLVIASGQTVIILTQGTDLSLGSVVSLVCVLWILLLNLGFPMAAAILLCLLTSVFCGLLNGFIASKFRIPVFITTLGTQNIFKSAALLLCGSITIYHNHPIFRLIAKSGIFQLTWSSLIALAMFGLTAFLLTRTVFGMRIRALGGNEEAITVSGASADRYRICAFAYASLMAGIGGLLICCRIESGNPNAGNGLEFNAVAASLLGGASLREGRGGVGGTVFGVLLIQILKSGLMQAGVSSIYQNAIIGTVVLAAIIFDAAFRRFKEDREEAGI